MDRPLKNIVAFSCLSFIEALQVLIIVVLVFSFIPIPVSAFVQKLYPLSLYDVRPKREIFFYHVWVIFGIGLQALLLFLNHRKIKEGDIWRDQLPYTVTMAAFVFVQIFAVFKILLCGDAAWARDLFYVFLGGSLLARVFWPEVVRLVGKFWAAGMDLAMTWRGYLWLDAGVALLLLLLVFVPHLEEVLTRMFSYDKFYHFDSFIMAPAWAHHHGLVLNRDVTSEYSLLVPIIFDGLMGLMGGFSYAHAVAIMIALCAVYYFLFYALWRYWTGSFWLGLFAVVLCVKLQFFHWGVVPLIWIYPSATPLRTLPDIFFLFFILRFTEELDTRWLIAAACVNGIGLAWTMDVGVYMYGALLAAAAAFMYRQGPKILRRLIVVVLLPWAVALGVLGIFYGPLIGQPAFWHNVFEFAALFLQGWGALPITDGLKDKQFFAFCVGLTIPVLYLGTLLYSLGVFLWRRSKPHMFILIICVYGLGLYHYYVHRSAVTSYYAVIVPFIFVVLFWIRALLGAFSANWQKGIRVFLCGWALTGLITGYLFMYYPNVLNLSGYNWTAERNFYDQYFDFKWDAFLIDSLTRPGERVPVISSFETKILMQADRAPFFYYFPMMESEHMQGDKLRGIYLHTYARLSRTLKQLQDEKPGYIFIQNRLWTGAEAQDYANTHLAFRELMDYIRVHYRSENTGQYLTALKLK